MRGTLSDCLLGQDRVAGEVIHPHSYLCATLEVCSVSSAQNARGHLETAKIKSQRDVGLRNSSYVIHKVWWQA